MRPVCEEELHEILHILRNPHGFEYSDVQKVRHRAADILDKYQVYIIEKEKERGYDRSNKK